MEFQELVKNRRSCRVFQSDPLPEDHLAAIIDAGRWAPSPLNLQPWEFIVVTDADTKSRIHQAGEEARRSVIDQGGPGWVKKYDMNFLEAAPVLIVVLYDKDRKGLGDFFGQHHGAMQAAATCVQNIMLAATDNGYESLWFTFFEPSKMQAILNVPENLDIAAVVPVGKPGTEIKVPPRKPAVVHRQRYGNQG
jgi:nitroreductase